MPALPFNLVRRFLGFALIACCAVAVAQDAISPAEQHLFLSDHFQGAPANMTLHYSYLRGGTLQAARDGRIKMIVSPSKTVPDQHHVRFEYSSSDEQFELPESDEATGNPVILVFLQRDVAQMQRLTGGQAAYFRKGVRMALANAAEITSVSFEYAGKTVTGEQITVRPFVADPLRKRFERLADKVYTFTLSPAVPGTVYRMHTIARAAKDADAPLLEETLTLSGVEP
jgi:hypothetical protein